MRERTRRTVLGGIGTAVTAGIAGCSFMDGGGEDGGGGEEGGEGEDGSGGEEGKEDEGVEEG